MSPSVMGVGAEHPLDGTTLNLSILNSGGSVGGGDGGDLTWAMNQSLTLDGGVLAADGASGGGGGGSDGGDAGVALIIPIYLLVTVSIFSIVIFITGVAGNIMVLYVILHNMDMHNSTNLCLLSLSIADLLVLIVCMPTALTEFYGHEVWHFGLIMCKVVPLLENSAANASALTICAISIERYYAICRPLKVRLVCTYRGTAKVVAALWLIATAFTCPLIVLTVYEKKEYYDGTERMQCNTSIIMPWQRVYTIFLICAFFILPFIVLVLVYTRIGMKLFTQSAATRNQNANPRKSLSMRLRKQIILMLAIIATMFFICLLPFKVVIVWHIYATDKDYNRLGFEGYLNLMSFTRTLYYVNSAVNPIIYNLVSTRFRNYFKRTMRCNSASEVGNTIPPSTNFNSNGVAIRRYGGASSSSSEAKTVEQEKSVPLRPKNPKTICHYLYQ